MTRPPWRFLTYYGRNNQPLYDKINHMEINVLNRLFKSVLEQDRCSIVLCDLNHTIVYMNPASIKSYAKWGGSELVGKSLLDCHNSTSRERIRQVIDWFSSDCRHNIVHTFFNEKQNKDVYMVALRDEGQKLIGYYEKHEFRTKDETPFYDFS